MNNSSDAPRVHYYGTSWNEEYILPHFLRHYRPICEKFVIFDDASTDATRQILENEDSVTVRDMVTAPSYIVRNTRLYNEIWKESRGHADWVIVGNLDEFIYCDDFSGFLVDCGRQGITVIPTLGFEMIHRSRIGVEDDLLATVRLGAPWWAMSKVAIFDPNAIEEIAYEPGRHVCQPTGRVVAAEPGRVLNLHYKRAGIDETFARFQLQDGRRSQMEKSLAMGCQYGQDRAAFLDEWLDFEADAFNVFDWYESGAAYPIDVPWQLETVEVVHTEG